MLLLSKHKYFALIFLISFGCNNSYSQNLIANSSFENYTNIDCNGGFLRSTFPYTIVVDNWNQYNTPDYFNPVCPSSGFSVPLNAIGYSMAKEGNAYGGFILFQANYETKEYLYQQLSAPLQAGHTYCLSLFVSRSDGITHAVHSIGAYFSNTLASGSLGYINVIPQVLNQNGFIADTTNWTEIQGCFTATGGEQYITIGNFNSNADTDTLFVGSNNPTSGAYKYSYYYIDNVALYDQLSVGINELERENRFEIYPNPAKDILNIKGTLLKENTSIKIYNAIGEVVFKENMNSLNSSFNIGSLSNGIYFYDILAGDKMIKNDKIVIIK